MANEFDKAMAEGLLAARTSKWAKAIPLLQKGLKGRPDATALRELGKAFYNTSKAAKAVDELQSAAKLNDRDPETYLYLGMALSDLDRLEEARRAYKRFLVIEPTGARAKEITAVLENMGR